MSGQASPSDNVNESASGAETIDISVDWEVTGDTYVETTGEIRRYITSYRIHIAHGDPIFDWRLDFFNAENKRFQFIDRTNDYYEVACGQVGEHSVKYNSKLPQIKAVRIWI